MTVNGVKARAVAATNSIRIENGEGDLVFTMPKDGYIFIKWSLTSNSGAGRGRWLPSQKVK